MDKGNPMLRCTICRALAYPGTNACPKCGGMELEPAAASDITLTSIISLVALTDPDAIWESRIISYADDISAGALTPLIRQLAVAFDSHAIDAIRVDDSSGAKDIMRRWHLADGVIDAIIDAYAAATGRQAMSSPTESEPQHSTYPSSVVEQYELAEAYWFGQGVRRDDRQAAYWFEKAAEQGHRGAQYSAGWMHQHGRGVPQDYAKAASWYRKAAEQDQPFAQRNLGMLYEQGRGVEQDYRQAAYWFERSLRWNDPVSQCHLGTLYHNGQGVPQDDRQAVELYRKAAERNFADAQSNLGAMYEHGWGVERNLSRATYWYGKALDLYRKSAERGIPSAQRGLGRMYQEGRGVPQDIRQAVMWYRKAAEQGDAEAKQQLKRIEADQ